MRLCSQQYVSLVQEYYTELEPVFNECLTTDGSQWYCHTMTNANATRQGKEQKEMKSMLIALVPTNLNMTQTMSREYWGRKIYMKREPWNRSHLMVGNRTAPTCRNRNGWTRQTIYTSMNSKRLTRYKSHTNQKIDIWKWKINSTAECFEFQYW